MDLSLYANREDTSNPDRMQELKDKQRGIFAGTQILSGLGGLVDAKSKSIENFGKILGVDNLDIDRIKNPLAESSRQATLADRQNEEAMVERAKQSSYANLLSGLQDKLRGSAETAKNLDKNTMGLYSQG